MSLRPEGATPAIITDHAFQPRNGPRFPGPYSALEPAPNPYLCGFQDCRLAEAAHAETTVER